jgi:hypothetical protein
MEMMTISPPFVDRGGDHGLLRGPAVRRPGRAGVRCASVTGGPDADAGGVRA